MLFYFGYINQLKEISFKLTRCLDRRIFGLIESQLQSKIGLIVCIYVVWQS